MSDETKLRPWNSRSGMALATLAAVAAFAIAFAGVLGLVVAPASIIVPLAPLFLVVGSGAACCVILVKRQSHSASAVAIAVAVTAVGVAWYAFVVPGGWDHWIGPPVGLLVAALLACVAASTAPRRRSDEAHGGATRPGTRTGLITLAIGGGCLTLFSRVVLHMGAAAEYTELRAVQSAGYYVMSLAAFTAFASAVVMVRWLRVGLVMALAAAAAAIVGGGMLGSGGFLGY